MKPRRNAMLSCGLWNNSNNNCNISSTSTAAITTETAAKHNDRSNNYSNK